MGISTAKTRPYGDSFWILLGSLLLVLEISILAVKMRWIGASLRINPDKSAPIGEVVDRENRLQQRNRGSLSWYQLDKGDQVHANDTLLTGPRSRAIIKIQGEGLIEMQEETLLRLSEPAYFSTSSTLQVEVPQGKVRIRSREKPIQVKLKDRTLSVRESSEMVVKQKPFEKEFSVEVEKGSIEIEPISAGEIPKQMSSGEQVTVGAEKVITGPRPIEVHHRVPYSGERFIATQGSSRVQFRWEGDGDVVLEVSSSTHLDGKPVFSERTKTEIDFSPGHYFWRLRRDTEVTPAIDFFVIPVVQYELKGPDRDRAVLGRRVELRWNPVEGVEHYRVQLSRDPKFQTIEMERESIDPSIQLLDVPPGHFYWRVIGKSGAFGELPPSEPSEIHIKKRLLAPKTRGVKVLDDEGAIYSPTKQWWRALIDLLIPDASAADKKLLLYFEWDEIPGASLYRLQVAADDKFRVDVTQIEVGQNHHKLLLPRRDKYYWRVAAIDSDGDVHRFSEVEVVYRAAIEKPKKIVVEAPKEEFVYTPPPPPPPPSRKQIEESPEQRRQIASYFFHRKTEISAGVLTRGESLESRGAGISTDSSGVSPAVSLGLRGEMKNFIWSLLIDRPIVAYKKVSADSGFPRVLWPGLFSSIVSFQVPAWRADLETLLGFEIKTRAHFERANDDEIRIVSPIEVPLRLGLRYQLFENFGKFGLQTYLLSAPVGQVRSVGGGTLIDYTIAVGKYSLGLAAGLQMEKSWIAPRSYEEELFSYFGRANLSVPIP